MKSSDEMVKSLFERRKKYISEQNQKRKTTIKISASLAACFTVIVVAAMVAIPILSNNKNIAPSIDNENISSSVNTETADSTTKNENTLSDEKNHNMLNDGETQISLFKASLLDPDLDYYGKDELQHVDVILQGNRLYEQIPESEYTSYGIEKTLQKSDFGEFIGSITEIGPYSEDVLSTPCSQEPAIAGCEVFYYQPVNCDAVIIVRGNGHCSLFRFINFTEEGFSYSDNYKVFDVLSADDIARIDYQIEKPDGTLIVKKNEGSITDISDLQSFFNITMSLKPYIRENALSGDPEWLNEAREEYKQSSDDNQVYVEASVVLKNGLVMDFSYQPHLGTGYIPGHFFLSENDNDIMRKMFQE